LRPSTPTLAKPEKIKDGSSAVTIYVDKTELRKGFRLVYWQGRQRIRKYFSDYPSAKSEARRILANLRAGRVEAATADISDLDQLNRAKRVLAEIGVSLEKAVTDFAHAHKLLSGRNIPGFVQTHLERIGTIRDASVAQVAEEMIADKTNRGRGDNWIKDLRNFLLGTAAPRLKKPIMAVTLEDLEETLTKYSGRTRNNKIGLLVQLFNYAKGRYLPENEKTVAHKLDRDAVKPAEIEIWTPEEAKKILHTAYEDELGFFAIGIFAGIRTCEICVMDWSQVKPHPDPDESHIEVKAAGSKMKLGRRIVPILPPLAAFLAEIKPPKSGRIIPNMRMEKRMSEMEIRSKIPWKKNASRHSFGSYRMAEIKNVYQVAEEMGNSPAMVKKHYFQAVTKAEASKFWAIRP
jgi:integrase